MTVFAGVAECKELPRSPMRQGGFEQVGPAAEWYRKQRREYARIVQEMELASEQSRRVVGSNWYLYLHHRASTGQRWLQWRSFGQKHVHLTWDRIRDGVVLLPQVQRDWFINANERMEVLNAREGVARRALTLAERILEGGRHEAEI